MKKAINFKIFDFENRQFDVNEDKEVAKLILEKQYPGWEIIDHQDNSPEKGTPDFELTRGQERFWVELKNNDDALRKTQVEWLAKYPNEKVKLLFVDTDIPTRDTSPNTIFDILNPDLYIAECPHCGHIYSLQRFDSEENLTCSCEAKLNLSNLYKRNKIFEKKIDEKRLNPERNKTFTVNQTLKTLSEYSKNKEIPLEEIYEELKDKMTKEEIDETIEKLITANEIYRPKQGYIAVF